MNAQNKGKQNELRTVRGVLLQILPLIQADTRLPQNTALRASGYFMMVRYYRGNDPFARLLDELDMASFLTVLDETGGL